MEETKKDFGFIKNILNNSSLIKWVKKFTADGLMEENKAKDFDIETDENTITISDVGLVKMFFSSARFKGKTFISLDIKHIKETLALMDGEGRMIISEDKKLCYIQSENNVVVIAPVSENEEEEDNEEDVDDEEESPETSEE